MRSSAHAGLAGALLGAMLLAGVPLASAQTRQAPSQHPAEPPPRPPAAAPVAPVHKAEPHHPPVVTPHGSSHAQKPAAKPAPGKPAPAAKPQPKSPEQAAPPPAPPPPPKREAPPDNEKGSTTSLPLPRFASLRTDEVNMRAGPGTRYPIEWVYKRRDLPVEIEREFEIWRLVKDADGVRGWVHQATLIGRRSFQVEGHEATLRASPHESAGAVAILKPGVIGRIRSCEAKSEWCRVQVGAYSGYLLRSEFWGTLPGEAVGP